MKSSLIILLVRTKAMPLFLFNKPIVYLSLHSNRCYWFLCIKLTARGPAEFQGTWWFAVCGFHSTGRHFHWAVSVPLQKSFGVALRRSSCEVVDFENCLDVSIRILLMLLQPFVCHAAAREARREPGAAEQAIAVHPGTAAGSAPAPTASTVSTSHISQPVWLPTAPFHNFLKHFLPLSLSFTFFSFAPIPWAWATPFPHCWTLPCQHGGFLYLTSTACCCCFSS